MNKTLIRRTACCAWDTEEGVYIVESPLLPNFAGIDYNATKAWQLFDEMLEDVYQDYLDGRGIGVDSMYQRGRPPKGNTAFNCGIKPDTKATIETLAAELGCSQGEVVDYVVAFHRAVTSFPALVIGPNPIHITPPNRMTGATPAPRGSYVSEPAQPYGKKRQTSRAKKSPTATVKRTGKTKTNTR